MLEHKPTGGGDDGRMVMAKMEGGDDRQMEIGDGRGNAKCWRSEAHLPPVPRTQCAFVFVYVSHHKPSLDSLLAGMRCIVSGQNSVPFVLSLEFTRFEALNGCGDMGDLPQN